MITIELPMQRQRCWRRNVFDISCCVENFLADQRLKLSSNRYTIQRSIDATQKLPRDHERKSMDC